MTGFPFGDRRQRPTVMGPAAAPSHPVAGIATPAAPSNDHIDPARASAHGHSYVDIAPVPGHSRLVRRDVLG